MRVVRLSMGWGDNLYRYGPRLSNGFPSVVEAFVKEPDIRQIVGRWLPCPNGNVARRIWREQVPA